MNYISAVTVARIREWRAKWADEKWLAAELKLALEDLEPLLRRGKLKWREIRGVRPAVMMEVVERHPLDPFLGVEAYSLRMMAAGLANSGTQFFSLTLDPEVRAVRNQILEELRRLYEQLTAGQSSAVRVPQGGRGKSEEPPRKSRRGSAGSLPPETLRPVRDEEIPLARAQPVETPVQKATAESEKRVPTEAQAAILGDVAPAPKAEATTSPSVEAKVVPRAPPAAASRPEPAPLDSEIGSALKDWVTQGKEGSRLFKDLRRKGNFETHIQRWRENADLSAEDVQYRFILAFLGHMREVQIGGRRLVINFPKPRKMGVAEFEAMLAEGMILGTEGVDPRVLGLLRTTFKFLRNYLGSRLPD